MKRYKTIINFISALMLLSLFSSNIANASHYTRGYYNKHGTYVQGHRSMDPYESRRTGMHYRSNQVECCW
ncbi:hypothetical protein [Cysteiniphilum halobium]|uniref:hypothetical protein n=1 Tax=Cysteiniphilum halobium TaxID=2219059 RepID=UPI003F872699